MNVWKTILSGGISGTLSWLVSIPADLLKSRLQTGKSSIQK